MDGTFLRAYATSTPKPATTASSASPTPRPPTGGATRSTATPSGTRPRAWSPPGGLPLVSITAPANEHDHTHLLALLERFRDLYPDLQVAYLLLDRGYDTLYWSVPRA